MSHPISKNHFLIPVALIFLLSLGLYGMTLNDPFLYDDSDYITNNPNIRDIHNLKAIWHAYTAPARFIGFYSFALNYHFHQFNVVGYHLVNVLIHAFNGVLVWWLVQLLLSTPVGRNMPFALSQTRLAFFTALLFTAHPIQTQAVTYLTQRFTSLATLFYVAALCLYLNARIPPPDPKDRERRGLLILMYTGAFITAVMAMLTKEIALTLPIAIFLIEFSFFDSFKRENWFKQKWIWVGLLALSGLLSIIPAVYSFKVKSMLSMETFSGSHAGDQINWKTYSLTQSRVLVDYLRLFLAPAHQNLLYDYPVSKSIFDPRTFNCFMLLTGIAVTAWWTRRRQRLVSFGLFWFFLTLSVESSIIPIQHVIFEHRLYLPMVGLSPALCALLMQGISRPRYQTVSMLIIVLTLCFLTIQRNRVWAEPIILWSDVIKKSPNLASSYNNRGNAYSRAGQFDRAVSDYNRALRINPSFKRALLNRGIVYRDKKMYDLALNDYSRVIEINPHFVDPYYTRAELYVELKNWPAALNDYSRAIEIDPQSINGYLKRGNVYLKLNMFDQSLRDFDQALKLDPNDISGLNNRGVLRGMKGEFAGALADFNTVIARNPQDAGAYFNRSLAYQAQHQYPSALKDLLKARELGYPVKEGMVAFMKNQVSIGQGNGR